MPPKAKKKLDVLPPAAAAGVDSAAGDGDVDGSSSDNDDDLPDDVALLRSQFDSFQAKLAPLIAFVAASAAAGDASQPGTSTTANLGSSTSASSQALGSDSASGAGSDHHAAGSSDPSFQQPPPGVARADGAARPAIFGSAGLDQKRSPGAANTGVHSRPLPHYLQLRANHAPGSSMFPMLVPPDLLYTSHPMDPTHPCDLHQHLHTFGMDQANGLVEGSTQLLCPFPDFLSRDQQRFDPADEYTRAMASKANVRQKTGTGAGKPNVLWQRDLFNYERWYNTVAQLQLVAQELRHVTSLLATDFVDPGVDSAGSVSGSANEYEALWALDHLSDYVANMYHQCMEMVNLIQVRTDKGPPTAQRLQDELYAPKLAGYAPAFKKVYARLEKEQREADAKEQAKQRAASKFGKETAADASDTSGGRSRK